MDEILTEISEITVESLRCRLQGYASYGESVGPVTKTTKSLFMKKLAKKIFQERFPGISDTKAKLPASIHSDSDEKNINVDESGGSDLRGHSVDAMQQQNQVFYAISLPPDCTSEAQGVKLVFTDKVSALKAVKMHKGSRFKMFKSSEDAEDFSRTKAEQICPSSMTSPLTDLSQGLSMSGSVESMLFKAPKMPELVSLRKMIEKGEEDAFKQTVWNNPRYLISSGDTPVILQEGFRYNALHVAAKSNQPSTCQQILDTIQDPDFIKTLFTLDTDETCNNRIKFLTDLYLNMPDKGNCESPLHFACKFGFTEVVDVLICHPRTDRGFLNKHGESPAEIVCSRCCGNSSGTRQEILDLLEGCCFVPLLRSEDNCTQPVIGEPWSPEPSQRSLSVLLTRSSPKDPPLVVRAYAGPMTPSRADTFHKQWTTPPSGSPSHMRKRNQDIRCEDIDKGVERIGRKLAQDLDVPWAEYWEFLNTYVDLGSPKGLLLLDRYLKQQTSSLYPDGEFVDQDRLLEKNLKNNTTVDMFNAELIEYSPNCVLRADNKLNSAQETVSEIADSHRDEAVDNSLAKLGHLNFEEPDRKSGSSSSSGSNYASCSSSSDSDGEKFHNSLDMSEQCDNDEVFEDDSKTSENTEMCLTADENAGELLVELDNELVLVLQMKSVPSSTDHFNVYRSVQADATECDVESKDVKPLISTSPCASPSTFSLSTSQASDLLSPGTVDRMMTDLAAEFESKLSITKLAQLQEDLPHDSDANLLGQSMKESASSVELPTCTDISKSECSNTNSSNDARLKELPCQSPVRGANYCVQSPQTPWQQTRRGSSCIFIQGNEPSKLDLDVLRAVGDSYMDDNQYPAIAKWRKLILSFNDEARQKWPTPGRLRSSHRLTGSPDTQSMSSPALRAYPPSPLASPAGPLASAVGAASPHTGRQMTALPRFNLLDMLRRSSEND